MDDKAYVTPISPGYRQPPPPARGSLAGCVAIIAVIALGCSLLLNLLLIGSRTSALEQPGPSALHEKVVEGEGDDKVVAISVEGIIMDKQQGGGIFAVTGDGLVKRIKDQLEKAKADQSVKAVVLDVDSPGGTVSASDEIWNYLVQFRDSSKKPLVVHQGALAASGGYYISAAADEIICEPTTITGSIGVIMQGLNFSKLMNDHGVTDATITSGPNKDLLSPFRPVREEHLKILQATVDDMYGRFCTVVAQGIARRTHRSVEDVMPEVKKLADGRIYTAQQAVDLKLVDKIGYLEDAVSEASKRAGIAKAKLVKYTKQPSLMDVLSGNVDGKIDLGRGVSVHVDAGLLDELSSPRYLMLWRGQ